MLSQAYIKKEDGMNAVKSAKRADELQTEKHTFPTTQITPFPNLD
ncbi:MAG: hypothetical protein ABFD61_06100 [Chloroherpetonaceae bacterium]